MKICQKNTPITLRSLILLMRHSSGPFGEIPLRKTCAMIGVWGPTMEGQADVEKGKDVRSRRSWSKIEKNALIQWLTDIMNGG
ncbi:hypothetical protein ACS0TY_014780 [Phlomoides rotata]